MTLATCSGARGPLLSQSWSKSKGGMFEILHLLFWKNVRRHGKNWSNTIKYIWKSSSGSELYRGISVFIPRRQENIKKQYRNKVEKWRVSEARPLIIPSCMSMPCFRLPNDFKLHWSKTFDPFLASLRINEKSCPSVRPFVRPSVTCLSQFCRSVFLVWFSNWELSWYF